MVNVAALISQPGLSLTPLVLVDGSQEIRWVATSELSDPTPFFEGGEVLLTTGIQTRKWSQEWTRFVRALTTAGTVAVGLGIGDGLTYTDAPPPLIEACRTAGLNLFVVPRDTAFVAISHRLSRLIAEEEQAEAVQAVKDQRRLTTAAATPDGAGAVLPVLADILGGATVLLSTDGEVTLGPFGIRRSDLDVAQLVSEIDGLNRKRSPAAVTVADPNSTTVLQPIGMTRRSSYLAARGPARLSGSQRGAVATAVALLSLIDEQGQRLAHSHHRLRGRALELLLAGDRDTADLILRIGSGDRGLPAQLRIVRAVGAPDAMAQARSQAEERGLMATESDGQLCLGTEAAAVAGIATLLTESGLTVGVGTPVAPVAAADSHRCAGIALQHADSSRPVVYWDDVLADGPLGLIDRAAAADFAASYLGELSDEQRTDLRCFLQCNGSHLRMSRALGLHRNTVRHRIAAIATKLPGSLDDPAVRAGAWFALQAIGR